jgi:hypothetical protein
VEFYLLNYFNPGIYHRTNFTERGGQAMRQFGCTSCHISELVVETDRRVAASRPSTIRRTGTSTTSTLPLRRASSRWTTAPVIHP